MEKRTFEVKIYYTGFCSYEIEATDEVDAIKQGRELELDGGILSTLENWEEADTAEEIGQSSGDA